MTISRRRRLLVDECVPGPFARALDELRPRTVQQLCWAGTTNGNLLARAAGEFDVVFTVDSDFAGLSDTVAYPLGVVILQVQHGFRSAPQARRCGKDCDSQGAHECCNSHRWLTK
ncbi:MAG: DUF5615 family PIN-like protein [Gemmatimonadaceae bacterium]